MLLIYLHGFNSDGEGGKFQLLKKHFPEATVLSPDLPADPDGVPIVIQNILKEHPDPNWFPIGTSLGGFYSYCVSAHFNRPCFLFNPSLEPHLTIKDKVGHYKTFTKQRDYHFKTEYLSKLEREITAANALINIKNLNFFLATDDEVLDLSGIPNSFPNANTMKWYDNAGHRFTRFEEVLEEVKLIIQAK